MIPLSGGEIPLMEHQRGQIEQLVTSLQNSSVSSGLIVLDKILALQGQADPLELQTIYVDGLIGLLRKNPTPVALQEIDQRLRQTPAYAEDPQKIANHAQEVVALVPRQANFAAALAVANSIVGIRGYGSSLNLQEAHAHALFEAARLPGAKTKTTVEQVRQIPSFRDSADIQFACAKICCNGTSQATQQQEIEEAIAVIESLPLLPQTPTIQESLERAVRNRSRFLELQAAAKSQSKVKLSPKILILTLVALVAVAAIAISVSKRKSLPTPIAASPTPSSIVPASENDLKNYLSKANTALIDNDLDQATTQGLMALRLAESIGQTQYRDDALDLLGTAYTRLQQPEQALGHYRQVSQAALSKFAGAHLALAQQAVQDEKQERALSEISSALILCELMKSPDRELLQRIALVSEQAQLFSQASIAQQRLGELGKAADSAEQAGEYERALQLLKTLVGQDPTAKPKLSAFRARAGAKTLELAEIALVNKDLDSADQQAQSALKQFEGAGKVQEEKARALTVLAKVAYLREGYPEAQAFAKRANAASPNPERLARYKTYAFKDAEVITREELKVDTFVFPPAKKTSKNYTYVYVLGASGDYVSGGAEELFQAPRDDIKPRLTYGRRSQGVTVNLETFEGRHYAFDFDAGRNQVLKPGSYNEATRAPFNNNNPGMSYGGNGRGCNTSQGRFVIHEIQWEGDRILRFAADFITSCDSGKDKAAFGKVRYNSFYE